MTLPTPTPAQLEVMALELVALAERAGLVLTIEQISLYPPAMGHYQTVVSVRPARSKS
jgi:hypothetical protein